MNCKVCKNDYEPKKRVCKKCCGLKITEHKLSSKGVVFLKKALKKLISEV